MASRTRLCTSIVADTPEEMAAKASQAFSLGSDLVEFRIDSLSGGISVKEVESRLKRYARRAVLTVRSAREGGGFQGNDGERLGIISRLSGLRPAFIDVELVTARENQEWLKSLPRSAKRIVSWHDFRATPSLPELLQISKEGLKYGAVVKIVTTANSVEDNLTALALCEKRPGKVVAFCMGEQGVISRVLSMAVKAPIAYASLPNAAVAPGQLSVSTMKRLRGMVA